MFSSPVTHCDSPACVAMKPSRLWPRWPTVIGLGVGGAADRQIQVDQRAARVVRRQPVLPSDIRPPRDDRLGIGDGLAGVRRSFGVLAGGQEKAPDEVPVRADGLGHDAEPIIDRLPPACTLQATIELANLETERDDDEKDRAKRQGQPPASELQLGGVAFARLVDVGDDHQALVDDRRHSSRVERVHLGPRQRQARAGRAERQLLRDPSACPRSSAARRWRRIDRCAS